MSEGRVIKSTGSWYEVEDCDGHIWQCRLRGKMRLNGLRTTNPVAVGDVVSFEQEQGKETCVIEKVAPRNNVIIRKSVNLSKESHIIASNVDQAVLVATLAYPRTSTGFIDRFLVTAEAYHIPTIIVFNKNDIYDDEQLQQVETLCKAYNEIGYETFMVSAKTGFNTERLKDLLHDKLSLLSGHSGVGKSALINRLDPALNLKEGVISEVHEKGMHTTTFSQIFPLAFGGYIIDTPGIKEFGLFDIDKDTLAQRFPEMRALMDSCKFSNCTHLHEPQCAVKKAVADGLIQQWRYTNYVNMINADE
ncbi:MAG: ribosome small subunit-dependent GTPase A [Bacteroidales bacterium]|nr:ribosome small subunit-dependent GTPase A [Bacteroidales bacterium]